MNTKQIIVMKKIVLMLGLLFCIGCVDQPMTDADRDRFDRAMNQSMQNLQQQNQQQNPGVIFSPRQQQNNSTYWQEQNARRQYLESTRPKPYTPTPSPQLPIRGYQR
jgi:hypothetical protein